MTTQEDCKLSEQKDYQQHWNAAYNKNTTDKLGWYEEHSTQTIQLIEKTNLPKNASILNVGVGSSTLIDDLLDKGYTNLIANDLSEKALDDVKIRLKEKAKGVTFIVDDLTNSTKLTSLEEVALWNDRAVLHFFLKEEEQKAYFDLLKDKVAKDGFVIIAVFSKDGAEKCCGLPLQRYDVEMLTEKLGSDFELQESFDHVFVNPYGGERPYVYTLFKRVRK